ncbi:dTMP kinase [Euryarchaeota archaeon ex4484_162]|nr:MAG: dTMP kinase [Thermoplasmata archaeon]OYT57251.1 MAG: dTMP kinase [Euryarchaeota archaeon ex4484_162]HDM25066.1 dTMP kinase [Thermoplasmatales archaeon]
MKRFVTFEGIDGSGKSTISKRVYKKLGEMGYDVVLTFEPTDTSLGRIVKKCIEENSEPIMTTFAFIADRMQHVKELKRWLERGKIVLCDRYADSTYAYQAVQLENIIENPIRWLKDLHDEFILKPDLTFLCVLDVDKALDRIKNRGKLFSFERKDFLKKVQRNYLYLASLEKERFVLLDTSKSIDETVKECLDKILKR